MNDENISDLDEKSYSSVNCMKLDISNYFSDLKNEIDIQYAKALIENPSNNVNKQKWVQTINKVEKYEQEFLKAIIKPFAIYNLTDYDKLYFKIKQCSF